MNPTSLNHQLNNLNNNNTTVPPHNPTNNLTPLTGNLNGCYYDYPATFNSSSSNSSIALSNECDTYNQQNLMINDANLIPSFYQTFSQDVSKDANHPITVNHSPVNHLINHPSSLNQPINSTTNHHYNHHQFSTQTNYLKFPANGQHAPDNQFQSFLSSSGNHGVCNLLHNQNSKENIKLEASESDDRFDPLEHKRQTCNLRERARVQKLNKGFEDLKKTCSYFMPENAETNKITKLNILEKAYDLIVDFESQVNVSNTY